MPQRVLILGATSAIAGEVARLYAARGAQLCLVGRNGEKLARLVPELPAEQVTSARADFDLSIAADIERARSALGGVDVALIAHGDLGDQLESERTFEAAERLRANFTSVVGC